MVLISEHHTLELRGAPGINIGHVTLGADTYDFLKFHFHAGSEHRVDGTQHAMELHIVFKRRGAEDLLVIGVFFDVGADSAFLNNLAWGTIPATMASGSTHAVHSVDLHLVVPRDTSIPCYHYVGSLTTPECAPGVKWFVSGQRTHLSQAQLDVFTRLHPGSFRNVQNAHWNPPPNVQHCGISSPPSAAPAPVPGGAPPPNPAPPAPHHKGLPEPEPAPGGK
jgi:carbonic anhydrase